MTVQFTNQLYEIAVNKI